MSIELIVTGGTFDKQYNPIAGELGLADTAIKRILERVRCGVEIKVSPIMLVDSLEMTDTQRADIAAHCLNSDSKQIVITHGTDTMAHTAREIAQKVNDKTIVLTGAMIPYSIKNSDALFNLGTALAFVQSLPHGIYIAMNGRYFLWDNVRKNTEKGCFEESGK